MATYPEYRTPETERLKLHAEEYRNHLDHCADVLRQKLMCDADTKIITYNWLVNHYNPHPNFNVQHMCKVYNRILDAVERYRVPPGRGNIRRPRNKAVVEFEEPPFDPEVRE